MLLLVCLLAAAAEGWERKGKGTLPLADMVIKEGGREVCRAGTS